MPDKNGMECCDFIHVHEDIIKKVQSVVPDE